MEWAAVRGRGGGSGRVGRGGEVRRERGGHGGGRGVGGF